ncbi:MAG TPA: hypothetical protein VHL59_15890, partial [Thermoanaerobaculia bacterium]|nr:hypothetical protein [Thermoanaerobaculia bacterium]
ALLFAATVAFAQPNGDVLLTDDGTFFAADIEWAHEHPEVTTASATYIVLTIREPEAAPRRVIVPATLGHGSNSNPTLAYDNESGMLFVFWQFNRNAMSSELRFVSLDRNGNWSVPAVFESAVYHLRRNLRIALTRKAYDEAKDGTTTLVPEINVHATWWEENGAGEKAGYAMITIKNGEAGVQVFDPATFVSEKSERHEVGPDFNIEALRHPTLFESAGGDTVDLLFGDPETNGFHRVTIKPIGNARVRIPVGVQDKDIAPPPDWAMTEMSGRIEAISPHRDRLVFYVENEGALHYVVYRDGTWSAARSVALSDGITRETAVSAMRRLVGAH